MINRLDKGLPSPDVILCSRDSKSHTRSGYAPEVFLRRVEPFRCLPRDRSSSAPTHRRLPCPPRFIELLRGRALTLATRAYGAHRELPRLIRFALDASSSPTEGECTLR